MTDAPGRKRGGALALIGQSALESVRDATSKSSLPSPKYEGILPMVQPGDGADYLK
jgi:hypothetical protein